MKKRRSRRQKGRKATRVSTIKSLRAVVFQEGEWLSAQFLEYDIAAQARSVPELAYELQRILVGHFATSKKLGKRPFEGIPKAPQKFWDMFERSKIPLVPPKAATFRRIKMPELRVAADKAA
jgi:hypothetical protein